jgi:threonine dehydrogenase-like Zn-dependent dehydrogenase
VTYSSVAAPERAAPPAADAAVGTAAVLRSPRRFTVDRIPIPVPGAGQVRVALEGSGLCASSLPVWEGRDWFEYPLAPGAPGHEGWGRVDAVGDGVDTARVGMRVAMLSHHAFASHDVADAAHVVMLPDSLRDVPVPGEALGCAFNVFRRSGIEALQNVAIVGIGFLGAILTRLATDAGAQVIAVSRRPFALEVAAHFGASELVRLDEHTRVVTSVRALTNGRGCERVIEATGLQWPLDVASELTAERGRLVIAGYHQDGPRQVNLQLWNWRGLDVVNAHEREPAEHVRGMREAVDAVASGRIDPSPLYTHRFSPGDIDAAFDMLAARPNGFLKALVCR